MLDALKKYSPFLIILILASCIMWLYPAYKKTEKSSLEKDATIATLRKEVDSWKNVSTNRTTYYPNGRIKSTSGTSINSGTHSIENSTETTNHSISKHELTVTKRGLLNVNAYWDIQNLNPWPKAYSGSYQMGLIGPSIFVQPEPFVGMVGVGAYF